MAKWTVRELLELVKQKGASDLHLTAGVPPVLRINGRLRRVQGEPVMPADGERFADEILTQVQREQLNQAGEIDFAYSVPGVARFRVNAYYQRGSLSFAFRMIPFDILPLSELNLPSVVGDLARSHNGLVLVTGPTGSGKSTTLAAMVDLINSEYTRHIITLEDPIEFIHRHRRSIINQREVGTDTSSFASGLRAALREDPDVILVGEMRDLETIQIALRAAETGHLVLATLHTPNAPQTVERIIDVFPPHQQRLIQVQLASCLNGIIAQQLVPTTDGGRTVATEILIATPAVRNLLREGKTHQLYSIMQTGAKYGMHTMHASLKRLYDRGLIQHEEFSIRVDNHNNQIPGLGGLL